MSAEAGAVLSPARSPLGVVGSEASVALRDLGERCFQAQHAYDPLSATLLGVEGFDHLVIDPSAEADDAATAVFGSILDELDTLDTRSLREDERVDLGVLGAVARGAEGDARHSLWAANISAKTFVSRQALIFQALPVTPAHDRVTAERLLSRIGGLAAMVDALRERFAQEAARGRRSTKTGIGHAIAQLDAHFSPGPAQSPVLAALERIADAGVRDQAKRIMDDTVQPALGRLRDDLRADLLPAARDDDAVGISRIPGGDEGYLDAVRRFTTTDLTPEAIHLLGLELVEDLHAQYEAAGVPEAGRLPTRAAAERRSPQQTLDVIRAVMHRAEREWPAHFPSYELGDCVIEPVDPVEASNSAAGNYRPASADGRSAAAFRVVLSDAPLQSVHELEALTFHEAIPGHHLQLSVSQKLAIPRYRRRLDTEVCAFVEGWGLYAETLADELGLYSSAMARRGMIASALLRACRLVADTGIHWYGWSRWRAIEFLQRYSYATDANIVREVDRYIAWPGQALAYMIGRQEIIRLRALARETMGERFSLADFHGQVLGHGAVPLSTLDDSIRRWSGARPRTVRERTEEPR